MPNNRLPVHIDDFSLGVMNHRVGWKYPLGSAQTCTNFRFKGSSNNRGVGSLVPRFGFSDFTSDGGFTPDEIGSVYEYVQADGTKFRIASGGDDIYDITGGGWGTSIFTDANLNGEPIQYATFGNLLIAVHEDITTQKWTGIGSMSALLGTPPSNARWISTHKSRVFIANSSAGNSRLHFSALDNAEDWTTVDDAGFIDVSPDDGDEITGLASVGPVLYIFKKRSVWGLWGNGPSDHRLIRISKHVGCFDGRNIGIGPNVAFFFGNEGVWAVNERGLFHASEHMSDLETGADITETNVCGAVIDTEYWLSINGLVFVFDIELEAWTQFTNHLVNDIYVETDGTVLGAASDDSVVRILNSGLDDGGTDISCSWTSNLMHLGDMSRDKSLIRGYVVHEIAVAANNLTLEALPYGSQSAGETVTFDMTDAVPNTGISAGSSGFPQGQTAKLWSFTLSYSVNTSIGVPKFYNLSLDFEAEDRLT